MTMTKIEKVDAFLRADGAYRTASTAKKDAERALKLAAADLLPHIDNGERLDGTLGAVERRDKMTVPIELEVGGKPTALARVIARFKLASEVFVQRLDVRALRAEMARNPKLMAAVPLEAQPRIVPVGKSDEEE